MPFPATVDAAGLVLSSLPGPFQLSGALYVVDTDAASSSTLRVFKSTDGGNTWTEQDSVNEPSVLVAGGAVGSVTDGTTIFIASLNPSGFWQVCKFNTTTDHWGTTVTTTNQRDIAVFAPAGCTAFYRATDGNIVITDTIEPTPGVTVSPAYFLFDTVANTWTAFTPCGTTGSQATGPYFQLQSIAEGASGSCHFFFFVIGATPSTYELVHQSFSALNVLGPIDTISTVSTFGGGVFASGDGTTLAVVWQDGSNFSEVTVWQGADGSTPVWTSQNILTSGTGLNAWNITRQNSQTLLVAAYGNGASLITFSYWLDTGSGFGTEQMLSSTIPTFAGSELYSQPIGTNQIGCLYEGSVFFWLFTPGGGPSLPSVSPIAAGGILPLPSTLGTLCRYARIQHCKKQPVRPMLVGNVIAFRRNL